MSETGAVGAVEYEVVQAREVLGVWRKEGEVVSMSPRQAQYYLQPYGWGLRAKAVAGKSAPAKTETAKG